MADSLQGLLLEFLQHPSSKFVKDHPILLTPQTDAALMSALRELRDQGTPEDISQIEDCRRLFQLCRKVGAIKAFNSHKSRLTLDPDLRNLASTAKEKAMQSQLDPLPHLAQEAWNECQKVVEHGKFPGAHRHFQFTALQTATYTALHNFRINRDPASLNAAFSLGSRALEIGEPHWAGYNLVLTTLALACEFPGEGTADSLSRLQKALPIYDRAIKLQAPGSAAARAHRKNLARVLRKCTDLGGPISLLDQGIELLTSLINDPSADIGDRETSITLLSSALQSRFEKTARFDTLEQSIDLVEQHLKAVEHLDPTHASMCNNLGTALLERADRLKNLDDLEKAQKHLELALELNSPDNILRPSRLLNLGNCLHQLSSLRHDPALGELAETKWEEGLRIAAPGSREEMGLLMGIMGRTLEKFLESANPSTAAKAIELSERLLQSSSALPYDLAIAYVRKGHVYYSIFQKSGDATDARQAISAFAEAMKLDNAAPLLAYMARQAYIQTAALIGEWREAVKAGKELSSLHGKIMHLQVGAHKLTLLRQFRGSHLFHAYSLVKVGSVAEAIEILEAGQAQYIRDLWSDNVLSDYETAAPNDVEAIKEARVSAKKWIDDAKLDPSKARPEKLDSALGKLAGAEEKLRENPEFKTFKRSANINEIQATATCAPIVYLFSTPMEGMALVVDGQSVRHLPLPGLCKAAVVEGAIRHPDGKPGFLVIYSLKSEFEKTLGEDWKPYLAPYLNWIWRVAMEPIFEYLGKDHLAELVLIPCGFVGLLPFHAAFDQNGGGYAVDRARIRYALSSRFAASPKKYPKSPTITLAAVEDPNLPGIEAEIECLQEIFGPRCLEVIGKTLQSTEVLESMGASDIFHFTGHARAYANAPLSSLLYLGEKNYITLRRLLKYYFPQLRLVVLSSCETAMMGTELAEEGLGLPGGFLQAGATGVIASAWQVSDKSAPFLMSRFYWLIEKEGRLPAEALREAQIWIRDASRDQLSEWAHSGQTFTTPLQRVTLPEGERPFSDPFHWAAFSYFGT